MGDRREGRRPEFPDLPISERDLAARVECVVAGVAVFASAVEAEVVGRVGGQLDDPGEKKQNEEQGKEGCVSQERFGVGNGCPLVSGCRPQVREKILL
jgi:hypothetical protein